MIINGEAMRDGDACSCRRLNEQHTAFLDQLSNAGTKTSETPTHNQQERREAEGLLESRAVFELRKEVVEQKSDMEEDKEEIYSEEERQRFQGMVTETGGVCPFMPAGGFSYHSGSCQAAPSGTLTHAGSGNHDLFKSHQASQSCTNRDEFFEPTADGAEESENDGSKATMQLTSSLFTSENVDGDDLSTRGGEAQVSNGSLVYDLSALLVDNHAQSFTDHTWLQPAPTGWHFPVGIGLSEVVGHPLQFLGTSYYHGFQENPNFEGTFFIHVALHHVLLMCT